MATYLLDTSVLIDALNGKKGRRQTLRDLVLQGHTLASCPITVAEVYAGMRPKEEAVTTAFVQSLIYYEIAFETARRAGRLRKAFASSGKTLSLSDTLIAAVALDRGFVLFTDNQKDFPMPGLVLFSGSPN